MDNISSLCRDCIATFDRSTTGRCPHCGSPRIVSNPALFSLTIAHIDCDAFYASIEKRDDPSLLNKPLIVGGTGQRGVVSTACYIARTFGVRSAMPMYKARQLCPQATVMPPNMEKYMAVGHQIRRMMLELTPLVEPLSIDEAFLDLSGTELLHHRSAAATLAAMARKIEADIGVTVSVGLSYNKFLAKIASDLEKPRGFSVISKADAIDFLADKPVGIIPGIGAAAQSNLAKAGFRTLKDVRGVDESILFKALGRDAHRFARMAWGEDLRQVKPDREAKSVSAETTLDVDLTSFEALEPILWRLSEKVSRRLKKADLSAGGITLKLKDNQFRIRTRSRSGFATTQLAFRLFEPARQLLRTECDGTAYRLIGLGTTDLHPASEADQGDLSDPDLTKKINIEHAVDRLRDKFGLTAIQKGLALREAPAKKPSSKK